MSTFSPDAFKPGVRVLREARQAIGRPSYEECVIASVADGIVTLEDGQSFYVWNGREAPPDFKPGVTHSIAVIR